MDIQANPPFPGPANGRIPSFVAAALVFLFSANTLDMGGAIGLKYASYLPLAILAGIGLGRARFGLTAMNRLVFLFLAYPCFSLFLGIASGADPLLAASQVTPFLPAVLLAVLLLRYVPGNTLPFRIFCWCAFSLALAVIALFPLFLWAPDLAPVARLLDALSSPGFGYFGHRRPGEPDIPNIYFRATLFLVPAFAYFHLTGRKTAAWVSFLGLALSLSRAGTMLCLALYAADALRRGAIGPLAGLAALAAASYFLLPGSARHLLEAVTVHGDAIGVRLRHLDSLWTLFDENPLRLLFGQGAGAEFFSAGAGGDVSNIEIDHFNAIRKFGLAWFLPFLFFFVRTSADLIRGGDPEKRAIGVSLALMFLAAGTNPVFVNPLFFLAFVAALHACGAGDDLPR